jgi:hypothetical protein
MKYSLKVKASNNPSATIELDLLEDYNGEITKESCITITGLDNSFDYKEICAVLNESDLNKLIGMLLQAQQNIRKNG